jgi:phospholipase C
MRRWLFVGPLVLAGCDALLSASTLTNVQEGVWGFDAIATMTTPPDDPTLGCGVVLPADTLAPVRASCAFGPGTRVSDSLGIGVSTIHAIPIRHVIVMMKENRSFDHLLGKLHDRGQPSVEAVPADYSNPDVSGQAVFPAHATTTCIPFDPDHQSASIAACVDDGKMDGFVRNAAATTASDGTFAMRFYDASDLPFYYWLATTFAVGDRHFSPMAGGTFANRDFMMFGTNAGVVDTGVDYPSPRTPSIFQTLMVAGFTWGVYTDGSPLSGALGWDKGDPGVHSVTHLLDQLDAGTLPNVAFVDGLDNIEDDHPTADLQAGEAFSKQIYDHAVASPQWQRLAILWTYDEGGAFADHVAPPLACPAADSPFTELGPRIPLVVISPWAKRNYASHVVRDHTAITRFIETLFDLPALTARDANSDALFDMLDFTCGRDRSDGPAPSPGTGGCATPPTGGS